MTGCQTDTVPADNPPEPPPDFDAILLTEDCGLTRVTLDLDSGLDSIRQCLETEDVGVEHLDSGIDLWRDLDACLEDEPAMNFAAMLLVQLLRSPLGIPVIFGPVVLVSRGRYDEPTPLTPSARRFISQALSAVTLAVPSLDSELPEPEGH